MYHKERFEHEGAQLQRISMPVDGQCLYHAIRHHLGLSATEVRKMLLEEVEKWWKHMMPWDTGDEIKQFKSQTTDEKQLGNAQHIVLSCKVWRVRILVHHEGFSKYDFG